MQYSDADLCDDIRAVAATVGHAPSIAEYREHGSHSVTTYYNRFGSWQAALETAGFGSRDPQEAIDTADLLSALQELAQDTDDTTPPTAPMMNDHGPYWASTYRRHFGSWANALAAAGFDVDTSRRRPSPTDDDLIAELHRLASELDATPTVQDMASHGKYGSRTYARRFGSWTDAIAEADLEPAPSTPQIATADLIAELHRLESDLGRHPTSRDVAEHGEYSVATYQRRFESWSAAVTAAFDDSDRASNGPSE